HSHPADDFRLGVDDAIDLDDPIDDCIHRGDVITFNQGDDVGRTEERVRPNDTRDLPQKLHNPFGTGILSIDKHVRLDLHAFGHLCKVPVLVELEIARFTITIAHALSARGFTTLGNWRLIAIPLLRPSASILAVSASNCVTRPDHGGYVC